MSQKKIILSKFKDLYPTYDIFKLKVQSKVELMYPTLPAYMDDKKTHYTWEMLYTFLANKYDEFHCVNEDEVTHKLMFNAFNHLLPTLYGKTKMLSPEALALLTPEKLLSVIERRYNEDADSKYASTETVYSSTPDDSQLAGNFDVDNVHEKNVINRKDLTVRIRETANLIGKLKELGQLNLSGFVYDFVNSIEFSSLFEMMGDNAIVYKVIGPAGKDGKDGKDADGLPWLTDKYTDLAEFRNNAPLYEVVKYNVNDDGSNNAKEITFLVKTPNGVNSFRTYEEMKTYVDGKFAEIETRINQIIEEIQTIENAWTGSENAHGVDLASLQGDKGAFDLDGVKKLFATFKIDGLTPEVTQEVEVVKGKHVVHLASVDRTVDVSFQVQTAPIADGKHLLAISDFQSHGTTTKTIDDIKLVELLQNPTVTASIGSLGSGTLEDIYKAARGISVDGGNKNYANVNELGRLMKQNFITNGEKMIKTSDEITLVEKAPYNNGFTTGKVRYTDASSNILTGEYPVNITDAGILFTYTYGTRANIWNRLSAWQSSFGATSLHDGTTVSYNFNSTHIFKFSINKGQTYEVTVDDKFEANALVKYLTFKTNGQLHGVGGVDHSVAAHSAEGYQVKLSDVMSEAHPTAEIIFTFSSDLNKGDKLLDLSYTSAPQILVDRYAKAITIALAKQDKLTAPQLDILSGLKFTQSILDKINNLPTSSTDGSGKQDALTSDQLAAVNSGITSEKVTQIETNKQTLNAMKGGVTTYHYGTKADADTAKATITFKDGDIAWVGTTGDWTGYHFTGGNWVLNGTTSTHTATINAYTKAEADAKFAPKEFDFSGSNQALSYNLSNGKRYQIISKPAGDTSSVGNEVILHPIVSATDPTQIPQDTDQITYGTDLLWINKAATDIMSWSEIKTNVAAGKKMIIQKIEDGHYQLVKWIAPEDKLIFEDIQGTIFNGHPLDWEYIVPKGLKIFNDIKFASADEADINWGRVFKVDLTKKSQWEQLGSVIDMGYGNAVKFYLNVYHDADGAITKMKMTDVDNVGAGYAAFVMNKITINAVATNTIDNATIINDQDTHGVKVTDVSAFHRSDNLCEIFDLLGANSIIKLERKRGSVMYLGQLMSKEHGKFLDTDTEEIDYWLVNLFSSSSYGFLGVIKIPNKNLDWDTEYGTGSVYIGYKASHGITIGQLASGPMYLGKDASGTVEIGSTKWVANDGNGTIKHGNKVATFEEIIDKAKEATSSPLTKTLTLTFDDGTTEDIKVG